jgi:hypothetical protein
MPAPIDALARSLEKILCKPDLYIWLMVDRLDELFLRGSETERKDLQGLLRTLRLFVSDRLRVNVFLRDDILDQVVLRQGFTALSHITNRKSDTLDWSEEDILTMVVRRIFASKTLRERFNVNLELLKSSVEYHEMLFYIIFDDFVYRPPHQSRTLRWIYNHTKDGRGVVTPRDVITLVTRACQKQRDLFRADPGGDTARLVYGPAIRYGLEERSSDKRIIYLEAELTHKWPEIRKLVGGGSEYSEKAMKRVFGRSYKQSVADLEALGIIERSSRKGAPRFKIPYVYRRGLDCTQKFVLI